MADLAFSISFAPGNDEQLFLDEVVTVGLGAPTHSDKNRLRRLFFEAYTMASADLKRRTEATPDDAPRIVPNAERLERRRRVAARLGSGISLEGELNISDRLIDLCLGMYESNQLHYIAPDLCTKKTLE